jgi:hypothetical protein
MEKQEKFKIEEAISDVIQKFNTIEELIKEIIIKNINPQQENLSFTKKFVLHNSIISFGGKLKLFKQINNMKQTFTDGEIQKIFILLNIRNAFAHSPNVDIEPCIVFPFKFPAKFEYHVEISNSRKMFELKSMEKLYVEFNELYVYFKPKLENYLK